ncbi:MAG TPA: cytidylate kinase family protein [Patescibacteria group bacterium]|nr:cytidylate kinase family protein [Patescibacteria group bacterium]
MGKTLDLPGIKNITVSGRIGSGTTTLASGLSKALGWQLLEGGAIFEKFHKEMHKDELEVNARPDDFDRKYEERVKKMLKEDSHQIIQSHLAGFDAQGIEGVFKILVVCEDDGEDKLDVRIDRLVNRKGISVEEAKKEAKVREERNLDKWRRLYANGDENWVYWDRTYYDLVVNSFSHNADQSLQYTLEALGVK